MTDKYQIYLVSDSTGETLDRIFTAIKAQFENFNYYSQQFSFTRTQNQIDNILEDAKKNKDSVILYTIVDNKLSNFLIERAKEKNIPCFGVLDDLIINFSKLLKKKQHIFRVDNMLLMKSIMTELKPYNLQ